MVCARYVLSCPTLRLVRRPGVRSTTIKSGGRFVLPGPFDRLWYLAFAWPAGETNPETGPLCDFDCPSGHPQRRPSSPGYRLRGALRSGDAWRRLTRVRARTGTDPLLNSISPWDSTICAACESSPTRPAPEPTASRARESPGWSRSSASCPPDRASGHGRCPRNDRGMEIRQVAPRPLPSTGGPSPACTCRHTPDPPSTACGP